MNESRLWDKDNKFFVSKKNILLNGNGEIKLNSGWAKIEDTCYTKHDYIEKTDIEGNKIYANCSVFEFEVIEGCYCDILEIACECEHSKRVGYFSYNDNNAMYEIKSKQNEDFNRIFNLYRDRIKNIKIIDTIQQNKLGLYGDKK